MILALFENVIPWLLTNTPTILKLLAPFVPLGVEFLRRLPTHKTDRFEALLREVHGHLDNCEDIAAIARLGKSWPPKKEDPHVSENP